MSPKQTAMTSVDRAWLRMDTAENPMMISGVLMLEHPISIKRLKRTLEERFLKYHRFRQRVVDNGDRAYWQDDPMFDLDNHLHCIALPGKAGKKELQALASDLNS
ncbi:wax ester/triacylglycerol synthase domain-containing protein, partial [Marinobacter sp.]|uniref:wax ester/triacylglycerol synthase domain-containing protein n=1 Tax=Marinobacter sp. TaxID=50741 RepID=UPI0019DB5E05